MPVPLEDTIPDNKVFYAIGGAWCILRFLVKWALVAIMLLGLIRKLPQSPEGFMWLWWLPFIESSVVRWASENWDLLAIAWILWLHLSLVRRLESLESRSDSVDAFMGAMMHYVRASDVQYSDDLRRKGQPFKGLVYDEVAKGLARIFIGRKGVEIYIRQLLHQTRFVRGNESITLKKDLEAVLKQVRNDKPSDDF